MGLKFEISLVSASEQLKSELEGFKKYLEAYPGRNGRVRSQTTVEYYLCVVVKFAEWLSNKGIDDFKKATRKDVEDFILNYTAVKTQWGKGRKPIGVKTQPSWCRRNFIIAVLQALYKYLYRDSDVVPEQIRNINQLRIKPRLEERSRVRHPKELLSELDILKMLKACEIGESQLIVKRNRCLIALLYESGARLSEILGLKIEDVMPTDYGFKIFVHGKTGRRGIPIITAAPYLKDWLDVHPLAEDKEAPLFVTTENPIRPLSKASVHLIVKSLAKHAGINKRIYPHLFRHSRATQLAGMVTEPFLRKLGGWSPTSSAVYQYLHLSEADVESQLKRIYGIEEKPSEMLKPMECSFCKEYNPPHLTFCRRCGRPLKPQTVLNELDQAHQINQEVDELKAKLSRLELSMEQVLKALTLYLGPGALKLAKEQGLEEVMARIEKEYK
jgi:integrase